MPWILAGKARKCDRFWVFARVPNPGKQSIWRQCPPSARKQSTKKLPNRPGFTHVHPPCGRAKQVPFVKLAFQPGNGAFFELKKAFFADQVCVQMLQNKAFWPRFTFSQDDSHDSRESGDSRESEIRVIRANRPDTL